MKNLSRRTYLRNALMSVGSLILVNKTAKAASCGLTPGQAEGPFYPIDDQFDKDNDLTYIKGSSERARGEVVILSGVVRDENCKPLENVLVEIWQACDTGKYNHPSDPNTAALDPNFQYWGRAITNAKGEYSFKTIRPGYYRATSEWMRPAHIHLKAHRRGFEELTTQVYFKNDPYNSRDRILQSLSQAEREKVIVDFKAQNGSSLKKGNFDIGIKSL